MRYGTDPRRAKTWSVVAPFFRSGGSDRWIDDFIHDAPWTFQKIPLTAGDDDWHSRSHRATGISKWRYYWDQSLRAFPAAGVITVFPQAALMAAAQKKMRGVNTPLLAWCFNLGEYPRGIKRLVARSLLNTVDRFVVHSTGEIPLVSQFLDIPACKIEFVPLQRAPIQIEAGEDLDSPFIISMGSANRDYGTFFKAAELSQLPCKVVASRRSLEGLRIPSNILVESGLSPSECHRIVQRSRFSVVPLLDPNIASGQVTVNESIRMNKPVVATRSIGTIDYIRNGETGTLVAPHDPEALATAMLELWNDGTLRQRYARNAAEFAATFLSDEAAADALARIISQLEERR